MMQALRNIPIERKLTLVAMLTSGAALLLACGVIVGYEVLGLRRNMVEHVITTAKMVADNSASALTFDDPTSAGVTLRSLSADEHIIGAVIYDLHGRPFARYLRVGAPRLAVPPAQSNLNRFTGDYLEVSRDIAVAGEVIGTVYVRYDTAEIWESLRRSCYLMLGAMVAALLLALLLARKLQSLVSAPIIHLAKVVREVALAQDYSIRANQHGKDEVGRLIDGFNEMLGEIQRRDSALQAAQDELERRVEARTRELASSLSVLNATLDSTADGILAVTLEGEVLCCNRQFETMWQVPAEILAERTVEKLLAFLPTKVADPTTYLADIAQSRRSPEKDSFDVVELADGRTFERYNRAQLMQGKAAGQVINYRDVTKRKAAEARLVEVHSQLLETSRQAGMAEVATSVLHNVGNVLNSVNISAELVAEQMRTSKVANLGRVVQLLDEHAADLAGFVTSAQGRMLPEVLRQVHERLNHERRTTIEEIAVLSNHIEHIKEIVAMQQEYAKVSGVSEVLQPSDLLEDSLRMNKGALERHGITVERDYRQTPPIETEKHKVVQILVNLIRNAKYACDEGRQTGKWMKVQVAREADRVRISVTDNGIGIAPENLTRIFNHGFTTRKEGHGFGLHSGALAARELGGALLVESPGTGHGATFTLELPAVGAGRGGN